MKRLFYLVIINVLSVHCLFSQEFDLILTNTESGTKSYTARNSVTLGPNYTYTPSGGSLTIDIQNPIVNGVEVYAPTPVDPETRSLNTTTDYLPGATNGSFNINPIGGSTYTIPIEMLPGVNGLSSGLSIVYSSNSGPGIVGYGWQIGGLSIISRGPQQYYFDGAAKGIELATTDRFYLDGQRLVTTDSYAYGDANATYQTDNDIFTRVRPQGTNAYGPDWFKAETKSGLIYEYGNSTASKQKISGFSQVVNWYVSKVSDLFNNQIQFAYIQDNFSVYPAEITYGANTYTFYYKERFDKNYNYLKGTKIQQNLILDKIIVKYNSTIVKTYEFKYTFNNSLYNQYSTLNEVIEYGIGSSRFNSTAITYQLPASVSFSQTTNNTTHQYVNQSSLMVAGDYNGDGRTDFFCLPDPSRGATWTGMQMYLCSGLDNFFVGWTSPTPLDLNVLKDIQSLDINGDKKDDILYEIGNAVSSGFFYMLNNNGSFSSPVSFYSQFYNLNTGMLGKRRRQVEKQEKDGQLSGADYNGDGVSDILIIAPNGDWIIKSFVNSSGQMTSSLNTLGSGNISTLPTEALSGDFNGDGKAEIWSFEDNGMKIYSFLGSGSNLSAIYTTSSISKKNFFMLGDFNGDGKVDIFLYGTNRDMVPEYDWAQWQIQISTGVGFVQNIIPAKMGNLKDNYVRTGDFNGDGATDLMVTLAEVSWQNVTYFISKNNGTDFYSHIAPNYFLTKNNFYLGDFNGDAIFDFLCTDGESPWWTGYQVYKTTGNTNILLEKVANGLGFLTKVSYTKMTDPYSNRYQIGSGAVYPVLELKIPLSLVTSVQVDNGKGTMNTLDYYYEGAKMHIQGKGFLGFTKTSVQDAATNISSESISGYNTTYYYPQVLKTLSKRTNTTDTIEKVINIWSHVVLDALKKRVFPYVQSSAQTNKLTGHKVTTSTSGYDNYGNATTVTKSYLDGPTVTTTNTYNNIVSSSKWLLGRSTPTTLQYSNSDTTIIRTGTRVFDLNNNNLTSETWFSGTNNLIIRKYYYYSNGSLKQKTDSIAGYSRKTIYTYLSDNIRIDTETDPLSHSTTNTYDSYGRLSTKKDYLNNTVTTQYDNMHRTNVESSTFGDQTTFEYYWENPLNEPKLSLYSVKKTGIDGSVQKSFYDKRGRVLRSDIKGFDGTWIYNITKYNTKGQIDSISDPYYSSGSVLWNTYVYDNYGRKTNLNRPSGRNSSWVYGVNSGLVTETTANKQYTKTLSSDGTVSSATDAGGTISYVYYPDGKVRTITAPGGIITNIKYDLAGNQKLLDDPSAGTIRYSYNGFGELLTQQNGRLQTTLLKYNSNGTISQKESPDGIIKYRYNSNNQLVNVNSYGNVSHTYGYDSKGRVTSVIDSIPGTTPLTTSFTYDAIGRSSTITRPSGLVETIIYNSYGYPYRTDANGNAVWTTSSLNARSQVTAGQYGNNLSAGYGFNEYGFPTSITAGTNNSIQNFTYNFNATTGNLNSRQNINGTDLKETFNYDNLDRLDNVYKGVSNPVMSLDMAYDPNKGGITTKTDVGTLSYNISGKPYALSNVYPSPPPGIIPSTLDSLTYTSFESVSTILEGNYTASYVYNPEDERAKMEIKQSGSTILTRWYVGNNYIKETSGGVTKEYTFIGGDAYSAPVVAIKQSGNTTFYYLLRDHLGSITHIVNGSTGTTLYEYSYDAWGRMRSTTNWTNFAPGSEPVLFIAGRGFTGHEHLPWFNMINMNGRLYDPLSGQFLSPDNNIQAPDFTQNFNRYGYCLNNPLEYTDPDGEIFWLIPVGIGALIGAWEGHHIGAAHGAKGWNMVGYMVGGAVIGGAAGYVGASVFHGLVAGGGGISASMGAGMTSGMASGAITGGGFTALGGGSFSDIMSGTINGAVVGGFSGLAGAAAFQGANDFFKNTWGGVLQDILPTNTLSYMAGSTASQMTSNLVQGRNIFKDVDYGVNIGMIMPLSIDVARSRQSFKLSMARKYNTYPDREILSSDDFLSRTGLTTSGDLSLTTNVEGFSRYPVYEPSGFMDELFSNIYSQPRAEYWPVNINPFIPNYSSYIQTMYNLRLRR